MFRPVPVRNTGRRRLIINQDHKPSSQSVPQYLLAKLLGGLIGVNRRRLVCHFRRGKLLMKVWCSGASHIVTSSGLLGWVAHNTEHVFQRTHASDGRLCRGVSHCSRNGHSFVFATLLAAASLWSALGASTACHISPAQR